MIEGRALDALIAHHVFGITYEKKWGDYLKQDPNDSVAYDACPNYSTDIAAAWLVVLEMVRRNYEVSINHNLDIIGGKWECTLQQVPNKHHGWVTGVADDAPLAICRAVVKALELVV